VRNKALAVGAERWLRDLPGSVAEIEREWSITVGRSYEDPTEAFVAEATLDDGTPAVLKVHIPRAGDHARHEITVLGLAAGPRLRSAHRRRPVLPGAPGRRTRR
jgi:streptomycin 6-kinase